MTQQFTASEVHERERFEEWYTTHACNYSRDPIGSRDCSLQWESWKAALAAHFAQAQPHTAHPEHSCEECGGQNVTWFAPSELWNEVVRSPDGREPMLCPMCFIKRAEKVGHSKDAWSVCPEFYEESAQPPAARVTEVTGLTWEPPNVTVDVERVGRFRSGDEHIVRVTFRSSDDGRRMTCFYSANESAVGYLHAMLAAQENPNGV